ncbi:hypothetical protein BDW22DRAFT_1358864 [Trametopsis cervina]|nr:hypothetical protein BDW22DRAFT_1358864 [Trametopsis cervina]
MEQSTHDSRDDRRPYVRYGRSKRDSPAVQYTPGRDEGRPPHARYGRSMRGRPAAQYAPRRGHANQVAAMTVLQRSSKAIAKRPSKYAPNPFSRPWPPPRPRVRGGVSPAPSLVHTRISSTPHISHGKSQYPRTHARQGESGTSSKTRSAARAMTRSTQTMDVLHPDFAPRPQTPPGGHYYEKNGVLHFLAKSVSGFRNPPRKQLATKSVRNVVPRTNRHMYESDSSDEQLSGSDHSSHYSDPDPERRETIVITSDSEHAESSSDDDLPSLLTALGPLLAPAILQREGALPFLARNVRQCFITHCREIGIPVFPVIGPGIGLRVVYKFRATEDDDWQESHGSRQDWRCPLCDIHGVFNTREMLVYHLDCDHSEVASIWPEVHPTGQDIPWVLTIQWTSSKLITQLHQEEEDRGESPRIKVEEGFDFGQPQFESEESKPEIATDLSAQLSHVSITATSSRIAGDMPHLKSEEEPSEESLILRAIQGSEQQITSDEPEYPQPLRAPPRTGITEDGRLIPPPQDARWGPAAEPPLESCRPGGPKLYDLLNELPLEPFGVLAWAIVDREEDFFEQEDLEDEDKVVLALWNRWIMLNRQAFVFAASRLKQVTSFLDEYHQMLHRAAGWKAVRQFLLLLFADKLLTMSAVSKALKHYEGLVGMDEWYTDSNEPDEEEGQDQDQDDEDMR